MKSFEFGLVLPQHVRYFPSCPSISFLVFQFNLLLCGATAHERCRSLEKGLRQGRPRDDPLVVMFFFFFRFAPFSFTFHRR
jgi:hypothetical protein